MNEPLLKSSRFIIFLLIHEPIGRRVDVPELLLGTTGNGSGGIVAADSVENGVPTPGITVQGEDLKVGKGGKRGFVTDPLLELSKRHEFLAVHVGPSRYSMSDGLFYFRVGKEPMLLDVEFDTKVSGVRCLMKMLEEAEPCLDLVVAAGRVETDVKVSKVVKIYRGEL